MQLETVELTGGRVPLWAWLALVLAALAAYTVTLENGMVLRAGSDVVHELFHDGRHFLGFPCH
jgi:hypothetical protein